MASFEIFRGHAPVRMTFKGQKQLMRKLDALQERAGRRVMRKAVLASLKPIVRIARANVPGDINAEALLSGVWPDITTIKTSGSYSVRTTKKIRGKRRQRTRHVKDLSTVIRKGIGRRVKEYRASDVTYGVVGPMTRIRVEVGKRASYRIGSNRIRQKFVSLTALTNLVEYGTSSYKAQPFIRPAFDRARGPALAAFRNKLKTEIVKEAKRT